MFIAGVRYAQVAGDPETDGQVGGLLAAYDASNRELWRLKVYPNARRPGLEGDVQDVWFRSLRVEGGRLLVENERGERFEIDPAARRRGASTACRRRRPKPSRTSIRSRASNASAARVERRPVRGHAAASQLA